MVESYEKQRKDLIKEKNKFYSCVNYYKEDFNVMDRKLLKSKMCEEKHLRSIYKPNFLERLKERLNRFF